MRLPGVLPPGPGPSTGVVIVVVLGLVLWALIVAAVWAVAR